ncbi:hypothetical protein TNIN_79341 [Trichonephila inaurata madagascariensis]|uniref:Uncharacterized protein n=1 Tax=Trichonephila inaurata madagascariensis TaxID=2747483 RepID=A0A8X7C5A7_9ARAC|nr:hypothetical protein TNIN_79341 [Trichonephila inaurata madagascariensis]
MAASHAFIYFTAKAWVFSHEQKEERVLADNEREKNDPAEERGRFAWGARALSAHAPCIRHAADMCGGISTCAEERGNEVSLMLHGSRGLSFIYLFPLSFGILPLYCTVERAAIAIQGIAQRENGCGVTPDPWSSSSLTANWTVRPHHLERDSTRLTSGHRPK